MADQSSSSCSSYILYMGKPWKYTSASSRGVWHYPVALMYVKLRSRHKDFSAPWSKRWFTPHPTLWSGTVLGN